MWKKRLLAVLFVLGCVVSASTFVPQWADAWAAFCAYAAQGKVENFVCGSVGAWHAMEAGIVATALGAGMFVTAGVSFAVGL
jgi:hypothetical protein